MKNLILFSLLMTSASLATPATFNSQVVTVDYGKDSTEANLIFFSNGRVGFVGNTKSNSLSVAEKAKREHQDLAVKLDEKNKVVSLNFAPKAVTQKSKELSSQSLEQVIAKNMNSDLNFTAEEYTPTVIESVYDANTIFHRLNKAFRPRSQCYNRAMVWNYEEKVNHGINSMKVFLFFTSKYIRDYSYDWWFHTSPYLMVKEDDGQIKERTVDREFGDGAMLMNDWTHLFVKDQADCPVAKKYTDYSTHQYDHYCYIMKFSMFYWQPQDMENLELTGKTKTGFSTDDVEAAYAQAFWRRQTSPPEH